MQLVDSANLKTLPLILSKKVALLNMHSLGTQFFIAPIFSRGLSCFLHFILLLGLLITYMRKIYSKESLTRIGDLWNTRIVEYFYVGVSVFYAVFSVLSYFYWYKNCWFDEKLVTLLDFVLRAISWLAILVYFRCRFFGSNESRFPFWLRVWSGLFAVVSCYCLAVDVFCRDHLSVEIQYWVVDVVSVIVGIVFVCVGLVWNGRGAGGVLEEPLLDELCNGRGTCKARGGESVTPYANANVFSLLSFTWMGSLVAFGYKKTLDLEDVPQLASVDSVRGVYPCLRSKLESDGAVGSGITMCKLVKALLFSVRKEIIVTAFLALANTLASYVGPYLIDTFVQYLNGRRNFKYEGYLLVSAFLVAKLVECLTQRHWFFKLQQSGIRARGALISVIYNKALTLSCQSRQGQTSGEIINLMSVDAERIGDFGWYMHDPWLVILQVVLALIILYKDLGLASIAALVATILVMLINIPIGSRLENYQEKVMTSKDERMKATSEVLRNMRILKLQGWEMKFLSKIMELRKTEAEWLKKFLYTSAMTTFVFWGAPTFVSVFTFGACMVLGIPLEAGKILSALATFRILQEPIYNLPDTISMIAQTKVSLDRIVTFLRLEDLQPDVIERLPRGSSYTAVEIVNGNFSWDPSSSHPTLRDINLKVQQGMKVAICGTVGSGKSSLLSCILGEVPKISGTLRMCGTRAYVAQSPWIQSGKIEENILFGKEMDRERYSKVLESCALNKDLEILTFGDQTVIGERGINLSGGQKQRIQIARSLYQDADIYIFDDPFSAVDAHTGSHLFKECLLGFLNSKTVIYITHQVEFLPAADLIVVMRDGRITQAGKYDDILNSGTDFMELVGAHEKAMSEFESAEAEQDLEISDTTTEDKNMDNIINMDKVKGVLREENGDVQYKKPDLVGEEGQLVQEEEREKGKVDISVYWKYITAAYGGALVPFILLAQIFFQLLQIGSNYWMAWASPVSKDSEPAVNGSTLIIVYVALSIGSAFCVLVRALLLVIAGYKTATLLFNKMHACIFRAPMSFFDSTPSGRILNRASTDQSAVDLNIPYLVGSFAFSIIQLLGIIGVMCQAVWQVFIICIPVIILCLCYEQYYIPSARELSRLVGVCKAPAIQHFSETISGSTTIRSFDQELRFQDTNMDLTDAYSRPNFNSAGAMEWLCFRLDVLSSITFASSLIFLISIPVGVIDPGVAGLAVTYGLNLNMLQAWVIWNLCTMENKIISVERILQHTSVSTEPPLVIETNRPDSLWPQHGEVDIHDLQVRYAPHLPLVLRGITCTFLGGKKTGIVGRTGSGKSTLIQALFRIVDPAGGQITIDGVNISQIGLHDLRSRLSIIPQDPTMFEGTVRSNLDPLEEYTDDEIWLALDKCQLGDEVRKKEAKLDSTVSENGDNWSMGQRQLVCLGRVLLKKSKVLVLDEATASVDTATDNLIQHTLRQHFSECTVITIAHRITSVLDSDMILLLNNGLIEEFETPTKLLENKASSFAKLVAEYRLRSNSNFET